MLWGTTMKRFWLVLGLVAGCGSGEGLFGSGGTTSGSGGSPTASASSADATTSAGGEVSSTVAATVGAGGEGGSVMPPKPDVDCGMTQCPFGNDNACCWDQYGFYGKPQAECVMGQPNMDNCATTETSGTGYETRIECQEKGQCPNGQFCCGARKSFLCNLQECFYYETVRCQANCDFPNLELCDGPSYACPMLPLPQGGMVQAVCETSGLLPPGYSVCGYP